MKQQWWLVVCLFVVAPALAFGQAPSSVPPVVRFAGVAPVGAAGPVSLTFTLYDAQSAGKALWSETQEVAVDGDGRYSVLLGVTRPEGLPSPLFEAGVPRWLSVSGDGLAEQPRVALVSVPYAMKAADADTIAGRPLSDFVLAGERTGIGEDGLTYLDRSLLGRASGGAIVAGAAPGGATSGAAGYIGKFTDATSLGNSVLFESAGSVGVNTLTPQAPFHSVATLAPGAFFDVYSNSLGALPIVFRAARGTPTTPLAVQAGDILGGLAVRGYATSGFSQGKGQVMFRAAENWTDAATGTYLQFTTTPVGSSTYAERMRISPEGWVGIGTATPTHPLTVAGVVRSTAGGFVFPDGTTQTTASTGGASYSAGTGLALASNVFSVNFGGPGSASTVSRSDHTHSGTYLPVSGGSITGYLNLPATTTGTVGTITMANWVFLHGKGWMNTWVGPGAGSFSQVTGADHNTGVGGMSMGFLTTGTGNAALGAYALGSVTAGHSNTAAGFYSLYNTTTGSGNTAFGTQALRYTGTASSRNSAFGRDALLVNTADDISAFGYGSLARNTTGSENAAFGAYSGYENTTGFDNSAFGFNALRANVTGYRNSAFGTGALAATTAPFNSAFGAGSMEKTTSGGFNTAMGVNSLHANLTGHANTALGYGALLNSTGVSNTGVGYGALVDTTSGTLNTGIGYRAGVGNSGGSSNTFVGENSGTNLISLMNGTAIGAHAQVAASNSLVLGGTGLWAVKVGIGRPAPDASLDVVGDMKLTGPLTTGGGIQLDSSGNHSGDMNVGVLKFGAGGTGEGIGSVRTNGGTNQNGLTFYTGYSARMVITNGGDIGINTTAPSYKLDVAGSARISDCLRVYGTNYGNCSSDMRFKQDVRPFGAVLGKVAQLQPVRFRWRVAEFPSRGFQAGDQVGFIAQDVERAFPELVTTDEEGFKRVDYGELPFLTLAAVKELKARSDRLESENDALQKRLEALERAQRELMAQLDALKRKPR